MNQAVLRSGFENSTYKNRSKSRARSRFDRKESIKSESVSCTGKQTWGANMSLSWSRVTNWDENRSVSQGRNSSESGSAKSWT